MLIIYIFVQVNINSRFMLKNIGLFLIGYTLFVAVVWLLIDKVNISNEEEYAAEVEGVLNFAIKEYSNDIFMEDYYYDSFSLSPESVLSYHLNGKKGKVKLESSGEHEDMQCRLIYDCYGMNDSMYVYNLYDICSRILRENNNPNTISLAIYNSDDSLIASSNSKIEPHAFSNMLCTNRVSLGYYNAHYLVAYINKLPFYVGIEKILLFIVAIFVLYTYAMCKLIILICNDKRRLLLKERQFSYIRHEVIKPLVSLSDRMAIAIDEKDTLQFKPFKNCIDKIINASDTLLAADSEFNIDRTECNVQELIQSVIEIYGTVYRNVKWSVNVDEQVDKQLLDKRDMLMVISNIIDNAIKYNDKAIPEILVSCVGKDNLFEMKITDNGPGIEKRYLKKIFISYFRIPTNIKKMKTGMGIGLPLAKKIVNAHGGEIWAESEFGKGCCIVVQIPIFDYGT